MHTFHNALCGPDGLVDVTRIEIDCLPNGTFRWTAWDGAKRLVSAPMQRAEVSTFLTCTEIILLAMAAEPPQS